MEKKAIGVFVGSLRKESYSRKIANRISALMPDRFEMKMMELGRLELYNQDFDDDGNTPREWMGFRSKVKALDGFLFVTPEYNRSIPPVLKNALDIASRPYGQNAWDGKPGAVISISPGNLGGFGANHHLRQTMVFLNVPVMQQPEAYIGNVANILEAEGGTADNSGKDFLKTIADAFAKWLDKMIGDDSAV